jgi:hypothetical protein
MNTKIRKHALYRYNQRGYFVILNPTGRYVIEEYNDDFDREVFEFTIVEPTESEGLIGSNIWIAETDVNEIFNL